MPLLYFGYAIYLFLFQLSLFVFFLFFTLIHHLCHCRRRTALFLFVHQAILCPPQLHYFTAALQLFPSPLRYFHTLHCTPSRGNVHIGVFYQRYKIVWKASLNIFMYKKARLSLHVIFIFSFSVFLSISIICLKNMWSHCGALLLRLFYYYSPSSFFIFVRWHKHSAGLFGILWAFSTHRPSLWLSIDLWYKGSDKTLWTHICVYTYNSC